MARNPIDIGTIGNDGTGDSIRDAFRKVNDNFKELYQIIFKMTNLGVISLSNGRSYYKQIKKEYS